MTAGLRERKKLKTRAAIQREAMRLFLEKGFEETTIEDIAAAVEISPSTFFNYFPSKEEVVLQDDLDPLLFAAFDAQPADVPPIAAFRQAMRSVFLHLTPEQDALLQQRMRLLAAVPEIRAAMLNQFAGLVEQGAQMLARRLGRKPNDFAVRNLSGAFMGVMFAVFASAQDVPAADLLQLADEAMAHLEAGLPLDWKGRQN